MALTNSCRVLVLFGFIIISHFEASARKTETEIITVPDPEQQHVSNKTDDIQRFPEFPLPEGSL